MEQNFDQPFERTSFFITEDTAVVGTLDVLLSTTYSRSQLYLSRQLAQLHPELTMPMFSGMYRLERKMILMAELIIPKMVLS